MSAEPETKGGLPVLAFKNDKQWTAWLEKNHAKSKGLWVRLARKASAAQSGKPLTYDEAAAAFFATLNKSNRYAILWRIQTAKKPETKAQRIKTFIAMLKKKEKIHP